MNASGAAITRYAEKFAPVKAKTDAEILAAHKAIKTTVDDFRKQIAERYILKGDELTSDARLLESGVELNKADLTRMFDAAKAANNHTMMELAWRRSLKDGIVIERPYFSEKDLNDAADMMERFPIARISAFGAPPASSPPLPPPPYMIGTAQNLRIVM